MPWFRLAASQGNTGAQSSLGVRYREGQGVRLDFVEAARWHCKAADQATQKRSIILVWHTPTAKV
jgi:TPR repeat protein